jgi:hypothetical protein
LERRKNLFEKSGDDSTVDGILNLFEGRNREIFSAHGLIVPLVREKLEVSVQDKC